MALLPLKLFVKETEEVFLIRKTLQISEKDSNSAGIFAPPFISSFFSTSNGNILPFLRTWGKQKILISK